MLNRMEAFPEKTRKKEIGVFLLIYVTEKVDL